MTDELEIMHVHNSRTDAGNEIYWYFRVVNGKVDSQYQSEPGAIFINHNLRIAHLFNEPSWSDYGAVQDARKQFYHSFNEANFATWNLGDNVEPDTASMWYRDWKEFKQAFIDHGGAGTSSGETGSTVV